MIVRRASSDRGDEKELLLETLLEAGLCDAIPIAGGAMRPLFEPGDRVIVAPFLGLPSPGQIVIVRHQETVAARRLIDVRLAGGRRRYRLGADAAPAETIEVWREDLLGRPTAILRGGILRPVDDGPGRGAAARRQRPVLRRRDR